MIYPALEEFKPSEQEVIAAAAAKAELAFWAAIAEYFPQAKTGDLDLSASHGFTQAAQTAVGNWYAWNVAQEGAS
jgi:hypothetical protein